jgi:hypothetical protein
MQLILFGTSACHLCEQATELVTSIIADNPTIQLQPIDIAEQVHWQPRYAIRIPVLLHRKTERELSWPFDRMAVITFINELKNDCTI